MRSSNQEQTTPQPDTSCVGGSLGRRELLQWACACAFAAKTSSLLGNDAPSTAEARLYRLFDRIAGLMLEHSPQRMALLGLDTGAGEWARSRLNDASAAEAQRMIDLRSGWLAELKEVDREGLSGPAAVSYDTVRYQIEVMLQGGRRFKFGASDFATPYLLSPLNGAYQSIPDFLDSQHVIESVRDAEAYLSRLAQFAVVLDQETQRARADAAGGVVPPGFLIDKTLLQLRALHDTPVARTTLVSSFQRRTREKGIAGEWATRAAALVEGPIWTALARQIALLERWRPMAVSEAGVRRLPDGEAYYAFATRLNTTTALSALQIHRMGLESLEELTAQADAELKRQGMAGGTVGQRFATLYRDSRFLYPDTEAGRVQLLSDANDLVRRIASRLPDYFDTLPKTGLRIKRVPAEVEAGAPGGYYEAGSLDGARPAAYYINLRDTREVPRWMLPTLTYHEGIPGHHLQACLKLEAGLPLIRKIMGFPAYSEGWALYAEQLADEMGLYADDPFGHLGYLNDARLRAVRLVVDSGLHALGWSRERAIRYYIDALGAPVASAVSEIERYCAWPGQACSYMIGKLTWLELRSAARRRLAGRFDIRRFHELGLLAGPMPLQILTRQIANGLDERP